MSLIGVIDCGISNIRSVTNALFAISVPHIRVTTPGDVAKCSHLILPGDGAYKAGMDRMLQSGLLDALSDAVNREKYVLGICLGMQLLADDSNEFGICAGLGFITGNVTKLNPDDLSFPIPNIGWNHVQFLRQTRLTKGMGGAEFFYFMHSYAFSDPKLSYVSATFDYSGDVVAIIERENIFGVQFHPEKSQKAGLHLLANFAGLR